MNIIRTNTFTFLRFLPALGMFLTCFIAAGCSGYGRNTRAVSVDNDTIGAIPALSFNGDSAMLTVERQVAFGPRVPGSRPHKEAAAWLSQEMEKRGAKVYLQQTRLTTFDNVSIPVTNILASLNPEAEKRMMIVAHWDTRPWADEDPDKTKRRLPVEGANDGASGTAVCLELTRVLAGNPNLRQGVDFLLVDAEDWGPAGNDDSWAMGARYFVSNPPDSVWKIPDGVIVVDMVGDKDATFYPEYYSEISAPGLNRKIWSIAKELGYGNYFLDTTKGAITDDHIPFIEQGIPAVDIVDYRVSPRQGFPPSWHTTGDTPDKISPKTLQAVGRTLECLLLLDE